MKIVLYLLFYIITSIMILTYLFKEKKVVDYINKIVDKLLAKLGFESEKIRNDKILIFLNTLVLIILGILALNVDYTRNEILPIKNKIIIIGMIMNFSMLLGMYFKKYYYEHVAILNIVLIVFGKAMFGVDDKYFFIINIMLSIASIILIIYSNIELTNKIKKIFNSMYIIILVLIIQGYYLGNYAIPTGSMEPTIKVGDRIFANNVSYRFKSPQIGDIISFKEPLDNSLMYTKRITGTAGNTFKINEADHNIYINGEKSSLNREYSIEGILKLYNNPEIYIPKKGDKVKLLNILELDIVNGNGVIEIKREEFLAKNISKKYYKYLFGFFNSNTLDQISGVEQDLSNKRYTYVLESEGRFVLPILDFKYDEKLMTRLLNGEEIELESNYYMAMGDNTRNSNDSRFFGYVKEERIYGKLLLRWYPFNRVGLLNE
ncbi:signal peptidase I [Streptobacillus moniliformis]|uniref:Signal peptidase I n=1 Tax=Streptobacillus moniliformis (strain ATCC 14647 / DSM 12112 / NCTC 10651 / 9901) TaxID=519441 RepID=D1AWV0_STRM9|nr:signal peptidase I [Streptobacillus moniliformis]ACZ00776.1 signal peptidase I [Streptobacillus moniliformis DSM 12112]AVL42830.1 signal peptidase I [Streptobacillus moniliformis]SQA14094.1 Signal peptidase I [Streptobacillus moniliformis]